MLLLDTQLKQDRAQIDVATRYATNKRSSSNEGKLYSLLNGAFFWKGHVIKNGERAFLFF